MFIQTAKHKIATSYQQGVRECLLNSARGPVVKWMAVSHDWQLTDHGRRTMLTMNGENVQDKNWMVGMLKNMTYEVIRWIGALAKRAWPQHIPLSRPWRSWSSTAILGLRGLDCYTVLSPLAYILRCTSTRELPAGQSPGLVLRALGLSPVSFILVL